MDQGKTFEAQSSKETYEYSNFQNYLLKIPRDIPLRLFRTKMFSEIIFLYNKRYERRRRRSHVDRSSKYSFAMIGDNLVNIVHWEAARPSKSPVDPSRTSPGFIPLRSEKTKSPIYRVQGQVEHICTTWWRRMVYHLDAWRVRKRPYLVRCVLLRTFPPFFTPPFLGGYIFPQKFSHSDGLLVESKISRRKGTKEGRKSFWRFFPRFVPLREKF